MEPRPRLDEPLIGIMKAAEILGLQPSTLRAWSYKRKIRSYIVGGQLRFKMSDLEAAVIERRKA